MVALLVAQMLAVPPAARATAMTLPAATHAAELRNAPPVEVPAPALSVPLGDSTSGSPADPYVERTADQASKPAVAGSLISGGTDAHSRTISNGDGTYTATSSGGTINFLDGAGSWQAVDTTLVAADKDSDFAYRPRAVGYGLELAGSTGPNLARFTAFGRSLTLGAPDATGTQAASKSASTLRFRGVGASTIDLAATPDGLHIGATLANAQDAKALRFRFDTDGLEAVLQPDRQSIGFRDAAANQALFLLDAPVLIDAKGNRGTAVDVTVTELGKQRVVTGAVVTYTPSEAFLAAAAYPLTLDPTLGVWATSTSQTVRVIDGATGSALSGFTVGTNSANGESVCGHSNWHKYTTDSQGQVTIGGVNPDLGLVLTSCKTSYFTKDLTVTPTPGATITLTVWQTSTNQTLKVVDGASGTAQTGFTVGTNGANGSGGGSSATFCGHTNWYRYTTDSQGQVTIGGVNPDQPLVLVLCKTNYFTKDLTVTPTPGATLTLTVWSTSTGQVVKVTDGTTGSALSGFTVGTNGANGSPGGSQQSACGHSNWYKGTTDALGQVAISGVNPDLGLVLTLCKTNYFTKDLTVTPTPGATFTVSVWATSTTQTVKVVDGASGSALANIYIGPSQGSADASACGHMSYTPGNAPVTNASGLCQLDGVNPDSPLTLIVGGRPSDWISGGSFNMGYFQKTVALTPTPGATITVSAWTTSTTQTVKVVDGASGSALANIYLGPSQGSADASACGHMSYTPGNAPVTNASGLCQLDGVNPDSPLTLIVGGRPSDWIAGGSFNTGYFQKTLTLTPTPGATLTVSVWATSSTQAFMVVDGASANPIQIQLGAVTNGTLDATACPMTTFGPTSHHPSTTTAGTCTLDGVNPDNPVSVTLGPDALVGGQGGTYFTKTVTFTPSVGSTIIVLAYSPGDTRDQAIEIVSDGTTAYGNSAATLFAGVASAYKHRILLSFAPPVLPDGAFVTAATLTLTQKDTSTKSLGVYEIASSWGSSVLWGTQPTVGSLDATVAMPGTNGATVAVDVTGWATRAFERTLTNTTGRYGFELRDTDETTNGQGVTIGGNGGGASIPTLTVTYAVVGATITFSEVLGKDFQPSTMTAAQTTTLPLVIKNSGPDDWNSSGNVQYVAAYRWLDPNRQLLSIAGFSPSGTLNLPTRVAAGSTVNVDLPVLAPPQPIRATLRLDVGLRVGATFHYFSDGALPVLYNAPAKPAGADDGYTNYVGTSVVMRNEYRIEVVDHPSGLPLGATLAEGGSLGIDAWAGALTYSATDLSVPDRGHDLTFGRTYDSALTGSCSVVLFACGWSTSADERMASGLTPSPVYVDATGRQHAGQIDDVGQVRLDGATYDVQRRRVTLLDEAARTPWTPAAPTPVTSPVYAGTYAWQVADGARATLSGLSVKLNTYPTIAWATRTQSANQSALVFSAVDQSGRVVSLAYAHGSGFATGATYTLVDTTGSTVGAWVAVSHSVYGDLRSQDPTLGQELTLTGIALVGAPGAGATTFDGVIMTPSTTTLFGDTNPSWTGNGSAASTETTDVYAGSAALQVTPPSSASDSTNAPYQTLTANPQLVATPFLSWAWRKVTGTSVALQVSLTNRSSGATAKIDYYAGAAPTITDGALAIPVGTSLPTAWTAVTRNVLDDARGQLGWWTDPASAAPAPDKFGPAGDFVTLTGWKLIPYDGAGAPALFDAIGLLSYPSAASDVTHDWALVDAADNVRYFNDGGRPTQLADANGNTQNYAWTYTASSDTWQLTAISEGYDAARALAFTYPQAGTVTVSDVGGRSVTYTISGGDLVSATSFRGGSTNYQYDSAHRLTAVRDPRYTAQNDYQAAIAYDASHRAQTVYAGDPSRNRVLVAVVSRTAGVVAGLTGIQYQDPTLSSASSSAVVEFNPNGTELNDYAPKTGTTLPTSADLRKAYANDGLDAAMTVTSYRTSGQGNPLVSRSGSAAGAVLNTFYDPFPVLQSSWQQSPAEYATSTDGPKLQYKTTTTYDAHHNVVSVTDALGHTVFTHYDARHQVTGSDDAGFVANAGFDASLTSWSTTGSPSWSATGGNGGGLIFNGGALLPAGATLTQAITLAQGQTFHFQIDGKNGISAGLKYHKSSGWTTLGSLGPVGTGSYATAAADFTIPSDADTAGLQITLTGATNGAVDNVVVETTYASATYDTYGNVATTTDIGGHVTQYSYAASGQGYYGAGVYPSSVVANVVSGGSNPDQNATSAATYNKLGNVLTSTDPDQRTTTTVYAANGTDVASVADPAGNTKSVTSYDTEGHAFASVSPNGNATGADPTLFTTHYAYGEFGQVTDVTDPTGVVSHTDVNLAGKPVATYANYQGDGSSRTGVANVVTTSTYDANGNVTQTIRDAGSGTLNLTTSASYDQLGAQVSATDALGNVTTMYFDAGGRPTGTRTAMPPSGSPAPLCPGSQSVYCNSVATLDVLGRTTGTTDAAGHTTSTVYDLDGRPVSSTDGRGNVTWTQYDAAGRVTAATDPLGRVTSAAYDGLGRRILVTAPNGDFTKTAYDAAGQTTDVSTPAAAGTADANLVWGHTSYDAAGRATSVTAHYVAGGGSAGDRNVVTSYTYDADGNVATKVDPPAGVGGTGPTTLTAYDALDRVSAITLHRVTGQSGSSASLVRGEPGIRHFWRLDEPSGTSADDAIGTTNGTLSGGVTLGQPGALANDADAAMRFDGSSGSASFAGAGATGDTFSFEAWFKPSSLSGTAALADTGTDGTGWMLTVGTGGVSFWGGANDATKIAHTSAGLSSGTWYHLVVTKAASATHLYLNGTDVTVADTNVSFGADSNPLRLANRAAASNAFAGTLDEVALYDRALPSSAALAHYQAGGLGANSDTNLTSAFTYDALGRKVATADAAGVVTAYAFDRAGRATSTTLNWLPGQSATVSQNVTSSYAYDAAGEETAYCPPNAVQAASCATLSWAYGYDAAGHFTSLTAPTGSTLGTKTATFDPAGRLTGSYDGLHTASNFVYDGNNNLTGVQYAGGGAPTIAYTYVYDAANRRTSAANGSDTLGFGYDTNDRLSSVIRGSTNLWAATYNADGTMATQTEPAGGASFTYDALSRLASASMSSLFSGSATFTWQPDGLLGSRVLPAGASESFTYDGAKRPTSANLTNGGTLATLSAAYDRLSNRTSDGQSIAGVSGIAGSSTLTFSYDPLRRVTGYACSACSPTSVSYSYDADSNRLSAGAITFAYNVDDSAASETQGQTTHLFAYDAAGNLTSSAVTFNQNTAYTYDVENHLTNAVAPGQPAVAYTLDALGRRLTRADGSATSTYTYVGTGPTVDRVVTGSTIFDSAIDASGDRLTVGGSATLATFRGDVAALVSASGTSISDAYRYDPYGLMLATAGTSSNPWRFQGRLLETTTGEYDFGARQYDPGLGAFASIDTLLGSALDPLSLNRYLYANANPESLVDPDGHKNVDPEGNPSAAQQHVAALKARLDTLNAQAVAFAKLASDMAAAAQIAALAAAGAALEALAYAALADAATTYKDANHNRDLAEAASRTAADFSRIAAADSAAAQQAASDAQSAADQAKDIARDLGNTRLASRGQTAAAQASVSADAAASAYADARWFKNEANVFAKDARVAAAYCREGHYLECQARPSRGPTDWSTVGSVLNGLSLAAGIIGTIAGLCVAVTAPAVPVSGSCLALSGVMAATSATAGIAAAGFTCGAKGASADCAFGIVGAAAGFAGLAASGAKLFGHLDEFNEFSIRVDTMLVGLTASVNSVFMQFLGR